MLEYLSFVVLCFDDKRLVVGLIFICLIVIYYILFIYYYGGYGGLNLRVFILLCIFMMIYV